MALFCETIEAFMEPGLFSHLEPINKSEFEYQKR
jgi:hypothetical protein